MDGIEKEPGESTGEPRPEDFVAPRTDGTEPPAEPIQQQKEKSEELVERLVESEEMVAIRSEAYATINALLAPGAPQTKPAGQETMLSRSEFVEKYLNPYLSHGLAAIERVAPEGREHARLDLVVISARFEQDCGFEPEAISRLGEINATLSDASSKELSSRWVESKVAWVGRPRLETEQLGEPLVESAEMVQLRQLASDTIESLRREIKESQAGFALNRDDFVARFLNPYLELGRTIIRQSIPEVYRETAELELAVMAAQFQADCDFKSNGEQSLVILTNEIKHARPESLPIFRKNLDVLKARAELKPALQPEIQIPQDRIERFLQGVTIDTFTEGENRGQLINCELTEDVSLPDFRLLVQKAIIPKLNEDDTVWVRGDNLPPGYLQALADKMSQTDFSVITVYNKESGQYVPVRDAGAEDEET